MNPLKLIKNKVVITFLIVSFGIYFIYDNLHQLNQIEKKFDFIYLCLAFLFGIIAIILSAYKFKLIIDITLKQNILFKSWLLIFVKSFIFNNLIPYSGVAYRGIHLKKNHNISYIDYLSMSYLFGFIGLSLLLLFAGFTLAINSHFLFFISGIIVFSILVKFKFYLINKISRIIFINKKINVLIDKVKILDGQWDKILSSDKKILFLTCFTISMLMDFLVYVSVFYSVIKNLELFDLICVYLVYSLSWIVRITPGNIGFQEILMGGVASLAGLGLISGIILSILLRLMNFICAFFIWGIIVVLRKKVG